MNTFVLGMLVGGAAVGIIAALVFINNKIKVVMGTLQLLTNKVSKIEKMSESTMMAAENFVDALQTSAQQMFVQNSGRPPADEFQDLRETFEDGIRNLENEDDDEDKEDWKKQ